MPSHVSCVTFRYPFSSASHFLRLDQNFRRIRLLLRPARVIHVVTAVTTAKGECAMTPSITEKPAVAQTTAPHEPGTLKKGLHGGREGHSYARQGHVGQGKKERHSSPQSLGRPPGQQNGQSAESAETARRSYPERPHESHRLAGPLGSWLSVLHLEKEAGPDPYLDPRREPRAPLLRKGLSPARGLDAAGVSPRRRVHLPSHRWLHPAFFSRCWLTSSKDASSPSRTAHLPV